MAGLPQDDEPLEVAPNDPDPVDPNSDDFLPSLSAKVSEYRQRLGRTPGNEDEPVDGLHHGLLKLFDDKLVLAPIGDNPGNVLDLATGTGIWAKDFGEQYPSSHVTATELNPMEPSGMSNVDFVVEDMNEDWPWPQGHFDLIHIRSVKGAVHRLHRLYGEAYDSLAPGGWIQHVELDATVTSDEVSFGEDHIFHRWSNYTSRYEGMLGYVRVAPEMKSELETAGFEDVTQLWRRVPLHTWPADGDLAEAGLYCLFNFEQSLYRPGFAGLVRCLGMDEEEAHRIIEEVQSELRDRSNCNWIRLTAVYARKPE